VLVFFRWYDVLVKIIRILNKKERKIISFMAHCISVCSSVTKQRFILGTVQPHRNTIALSQYHWIELCIWTCARKKQFIKRYIKHIHLTVDLKLINKMKILLSPLYIPDLRQTLRQPQLDILIFFNQKLRGLLKRKYMHTKLTFCKKTWVIIHLQNVHPMLV